MALFGWSRDAALPYESTDDDLVDPQFALAVFTTESRLLIRKPTV